MLKRRAMMEAAGWLRRSNESDTPGSKGDDHRAEMCLSKRVLIVPAERLQQHAPVSTGHQSGFLVISEFCC